MIRAIIHWALNNPLVVLLVVAGWIAVGVYAFLNVNVEAYPDPAPAIVEVVAQYPGASAEEVERQVSVPLEVAFAGMPGLTMTRSKSLFGLAHIRNQFEYGLDFWACRQEVINRLSILSQPLPAGVVPQISPQNPIGGGLLGPEFAINSTQTATDRVNIVSTALYGSLDSTTKINLSPFVNRASNVSSMVNYISYVFLHSGMSSTLAQAAESAASAQSSATAAAEAALYVVLTSSEYQVIH